METQLPIVVMEKLLVKSGAKRVAESAKRELRKILKREIEAISRKAGAFSKHAGRKTIKKEDIELSL